ncbi:GNAT family N-acetyltransferase [Ruegeria sp. 2012CJ41-6]|uniref:GNAT family N-acetyltransferase n=1 Tax=Ruegeria spongiae TaxID=2942209 RepID=A0ABT0Q7C5_9RHOB|nr:GNAT family N-acetyltransferase [Ruegeria spongiae]MCL6285779.1 GNAT family N-acetyltransferase [Ruegeria spongiae]
MLPTLDTLRLRLRPPRFDDWPDYARLMSSDRAVHMGGPFAVREAWGMFCNDVAQWELMGHGALMIDARDTGQCLGQVAINHGPLFPEHELGWMLYATAEGRGIAFEAAHAMRDWAFAALGLATLVSYIDADNARSRALAERLGARRDDSAARPDPGDLVYRHPRPAT